jgi:hypothetical protein
MPESSNITKIPAPRVELVDQRTGLISREWFRFFNNIYIITGGATQGVAQIENGGTGASTAAGARANLGVGSVTRVGGQGAVNGITLSGNVTSDGDLTLGGTLAGIDLTSQVAGVLPLANGGTGATARPYVSTKTVDFILSDIEGWIINNKTGSTCTVTMTDASLWDGRVVTFKNLQAQTLVSASSNIVPINSDTPGTAILPATVGAWATLVSDGTNWVIMAS